MLVYTHVAWKNCFKKMFVCEISCQKCRIVVTKLPTLNMVDGCRYNYCLIDNITNYSTACLVNCNRIQLNHRG